MRRTSKTVRCVCPPPCSGVYRETHSSKLWFPTHFLNGGRYQTMCVPEWHWWDCWVSLMGQQSNPMGFGQQEQWQIKSYQSKVIHWLGYSTDTINTSGKTDPLYSKTRTSAFLLCLHTKSHLSLTLQSRLSNRNFIYRASHPAACPREQSFLFVSLRMCKRKKKKKVHFLHPPRQWRIGI